MDGGKPWGCVEGRHRRPLLIGVLKALNWSRAMGKVACAALREAAKGRVCSWCWAVLILIRPSKPRELLPLSPAAGKQGCYWLMMIIINIVAPSLARTDGITSKLTL